ncbi:MAG: winged helix-turn-helix transcriptional regulator [Alphaproteobacteria bacterium]|nr:MAG: winged helix-turn-helix transcriptional regulator [Alphaproteobacteria bacterium]
MSTLRPWGETPPKHDPRTTISFQFWQLQMLWRRKVESALEAHDLTLMQYHLLAGVDFLSHDGVPVNQVSLSTFLGSAPAMTSQVLKILTTVKKHVARRTLKGDSRAKIVKLTPLGAVKLRKGKEIIEQINKDVFGVLQAAQVDFQQCITYLTSTIAAHEDTNVSQAIPPETS